MVFIDCPSIASTALQCSGRILRMGQGRICRFWILTLDHSYDQVIQANTCNKMLGIIAGQGNFKVTQDEIEQWKTANPSGEYTDEQAKARVLVAKCEKIYCGLFGQRSSRREWGDISDLTAKDDLPVRAADPSHEGDFYQDDLQPTETTPKSEAPARTFPTPTSLDIFGTTKPCASIQQQLAIAAMEREPG
ncbi:MAG: hypothetical protein Q9195_003710 [Heterodermia aff. obscurata]